MRRFVYIDGPSVCWEGQRLAAVRCGFASSLHDAISRDIVDGAWKLDYGRVHESVCPLPERGGFTSLFGVRPHQVDTIWSLGGVDAVVVEREPQSEAADKFDVMIATRLVEHSFAGMEPGDRAVLVAGDCELAPALQSLSSRGFPTTVAFWDHATARELKRVADEVVSLDAVFDRLSLGA
ncbi:NYN domain-containing protein [Mycobacterium sp. NPDC050551]|uniref:NYN domain-containing protein n=1 Tax=Mycobacterium sp. NPDC050551 TaxID=3155407 RepID=UPI003436C5BB